MTNAATPRTRVAVLVGSLRTDSVNRRIAEALRDQAPEGVELDIVDGLGALPFYNEDIDGAEAPSVVADLRRVVGSADRVLAVTPEYNGTMPAVLNNATSSPTSRCRRRRSTPTSSATRPSSPGSPTRSRRSLRPTRPWPPEPPLPTRRPRRVATPLTS
ncbi:NADPH-dependent FMN reductase [Intrasporangium flavum]|uniref:NADPH-dependent FMN reductase n=1 Tax=Intrasporangium flavum TaxID=1428657 RepID=UPI001A95A60F|nr:NADPH-dependent FMN reductase [Intrasporangium flavum]